MTRRNVRAGDVPRVDAQLAMARAFGDRSLKEHISSDPDVAIEDVGDGAELLVLASDGLWKVMSNQEAVDEARGIEDARKAAVRLVDEAVRRGASDNLTAVMVSFHPDAPPPSRANKRTGRVTRSISAEGLHSLRVLLEGQ